MHTRYRLLKICGAFPEAYEVFHPTDEDPEWLVGYFRLRHGHFTAFVDDNIVFSAYPEGDGIFSSTERIPYIIQAMIRIHYARGYRNHFSIHVDDADLSGTPFEDNNWKY